MKLDHFTLTDLESFRSTQKLAYDCVRAVEKKLKPGMTELQACTMMREWIRAKGVSHMFHEPFAWFGDRTAFRGFGNDRDFMPTDRVLAKGMAVILDIAPICDGYAADIGYSTSCGANADVEALNKALIDCRTFILQAVRARKSFRDIYRELDGVIARYGFVNVHRIYPERVLAHRVFRFEASPVTRLLQRLRFNGFGLPTYVYVLGKALLAKIAPGRFSSPVWNDGPESDHPPLTGLWAVEPHIATPDYQAGAKWEEILVVTEDDAYWLDDDVPHMEQARAKGWLKIRTQTRAAA